MSHEVARDSRYRLTLPDFIGYRVAAQAAGLERGKTMSDVTRSHDPIWESIFRAKEWGKYPPEHVIRFVARHFYNAPDRTAVRLLDVGSGPGANTWFMAREGFSVSSIEGATAAVERLQERLKKDGLVADARVGDFTRLPWPDATFDGAIDNAAICCNPWNASVRTIAEISRVLKPGGYFFSAHFTDRSWGYGSGPRVTAGEFQQLSEGPLANTGYHRFLSRTQIDELYAPFTAITADRLVQTMDGDTHQMEQWLVTCRKR